MNTVLVLSPEQVAMLAAALTKAARSDGNVRRAEELAAFANRITTAKPQPHINNFSELTQPTDAQEYRRRRSDGARQFDATFRVLDRFAGKARTPASGKGDLPQPRQD